MNHLQQNIKWQPEAGSISDRLWDVVIVGAGPAGAIAACHLAARHHSVLMLDRKKFPREKVCGDSLLPDALRCLDAIGIGAKIRNTGRRVTTCILFSPCRNEVEIPGEYLTIKRRQLDMIIAEKAVESGTVFALGEVKQLSILPDGLVSLTLTGRRKPVRSRIGIVATGVDVRLMHKMNWPAKKKPSGLALRCYVRSSLVLDRLVISFVIHNRFSVPGYAWVFPMPDNEYNVGFGLINLGRIRKGHINLKDKFKNFTDSFPLARELMQLSDATTALRAAALRYDFDGAYPFVRGPVVAVGETIGTTLPFAGEGIGKAMESGQLAAEAISRVLNASDLSELSRYAQQIESEFKTRYSGYRKAEKWLARSWTNDFIIGRCSKSRYAKEILSGIIAETNNPQDILSFKGIVKTLWK